MTRTPDHRRRTRTLTTSLSAAAVLAALLAVGGCGGDDDSDSSASSTKSSSPSGDDTAFIAEANEICKPVFTYYEKTSFPYKNFDPTHPDPKQLHAVAVYLRNSPLVSSLERLQALTPPDDLADTWKTFVAGTSSYADSAREQIQAGLAGDATGFTGAGGETVSQLPDLRTAALAAGFDKSEGSCETLFVG